MEKNVHLVFIDDEPSIIELVEVYLRNITHLKLTGLTTLTEAHNYIMSNHENIDLVVCDIGMDEGDDFEDGLALLSHLRDKGIAIKWSFCSGHAHLKNEVLCNEKLCVTAFLEKPFTKKELLAFIMSLIQN